MENPDKYVSYAESMEEALKLAEEWKAEGRFDVFRGQARCWPLLSSLHRMGESGFNEMTDRSLLLYHFMHGNPVLKEYLTNIDHFFAIAQHYGFATNHVDFTTDPKIALYFATNSPSNAIGEYACIICVKRTHFHEVMDFVEPVLSKYLGKKDLRPCFMDFDVKNLWRLQAQKGVFLFTPLAGMENLYPFHKIEFPYSQPFKEISSEDIYPVEKSAVETYLDHYLESERRSRNMKRIIDFIGTDKVRRIPKSSIFDYIVSSSPPHYSWRKKYLLGWLESTNEPWEKISSKASIDLELPHKHFRNFEDEEILLFIEEKLSSLPNIRTSIARLNVIRTSRPFSKKYCHLLNRGCNLIWNGMRLLPYTDREIASSLGRFIIMFCETRSEVNCENSRLLWGAIKVALSNGDGSNTRGFVSGYGVLQLKRKNILKYLKPEWLEDATDNPVALLQLIFKPKYLFSFNAIRELFVLDLIPTQTILELDGENPLIYYNPAYLDVFGLA